MLYEVTLLLHVCTLPYERKIEPAKAFCSLELKGSAGRNRSQHPNRSHKRAHLPSLL
jgi:hypothetical protein